MKQKTKKQLEYEKRKSAIMQKKWQDPRYRAEMLRKQRAIGYRCYPTERVV